MIMKAMRAFLRNRVWASAALALFLAGSNHCLATALSGSPMGCLSAPGAQSGAQAAKQTPSHCGHMAPGGATGDSKSSTATPNAGSPCCLELAPVSAPLVLKAETSSNAVLFAVSASIEVAREAALALTRVAVVSESPPPASDPCAPRAERAPPSA